MVHHISTSSKWESMVKIWMMKMRGWVSATGRTISNLDLASIEWLQEACGAIIITGHVWSESSKESKRFGSMISVRIVDVRKSSLKKLWILVVNAATLQQFFTFTIFLPMRFKSFKKRKKLEPLSLRCQGWYPFQFFRSHSWQLHGRCKSLQTTTSYKSLPFINLPRQRKSTRV